MKFFVIHNNGLNTCYIIFKYRFAVEEWIHSGKSFHIMRDHPYHSAVVLGGMWGGVKGCLPNLKAELKKWSKK